MGESKHSNSNGGESRPKSTLWSKTKRIAGLITIEPSLLVHMTASFMGNLLLSNLMLYKACNVNLGYNETFCTDLINKERGEELTDEEKAAQKVVSDIKIWSSVIDNSFPILYVLFLGAWSDTYGRKIPYLCSIFGYIVRYILLIMATYFESWNCETVVLLSSLPVALTGSRTAISMVIYSYVADTTSIADRTLKMGMATAVRTFGKSLGSALGGEMSRAGLGYYAIFGAAGALDIFGLVWAMFTIQDTRDREKTKNKTKWEAFKDVFDLGHLKDSAAAFVRKRKNGDRARLFLLVIALLSTMMPMQAEESIIYNFTRAQLGWNAAIFGYYNTYRMIIAFIGGVTSVGLLSKGLKLSDAIIGVLSSISQIASSFIYCFADRDWMMYLAPLVDILNGTMIIASRSMISKIIPRHETGKVNSVVGTLDTIAPLPASPIYNAIYSATLYTLPGAFFLFSAAVTIPALLVFTFLAFFRKREDVDPNLPIVGSDTSESRKSYTETDSVDSNLNKTEDLSPEKF